MSLSSLRVIRLQGHDGLSDITNRPYPPFEMVFHAAAQRHRTGPSNLAQHSVGWMAGAQKAPFCRTLTSIRFAKHDAGMTGPLSG
jgi:hypothetical protein